MNFYRVINIIYVYIVKLHDVFAIQIDHGYFLWAEVSGIYYISFYSQRKQDGKRRIFDTT